MCEFCESEKEVLYQTSTYIDLYMSHLEKKSVIKVKSINHKLPLSENNQAVRKAIFFINYCPECGRKLND